ncbi:MAG: REP-associated tyrosine transposase [Opitutaceae bacterium]
MPDLPARKTPAHQAVFDHGNRASIIFVTVCSAKRKPILATDVVHKLLIQSWHQADHFIVGRYVIMPDHIHLFCAPAIRDPLPIRKWIRFWKSQASKKWPNQDEHPIWQAEAWDRQLRSGDSYSEKWAYVQNNPVRHNFVQEFKDWPYLGELNKLMWHE